MELYSIPGYYSIFRNKTFNSGGLAFFIENKLSFKVLEEVSFMYEHLKLQVWYTGDLDPMMITFWEIIERY